MTSVTEDLSLLRAWAEVLVRPLVLVDFVSAPSDPTDNKTVLFDALLLPRRVCFRAFSGCVCQRALLCSELPPDLIAEPGSACQALSYCASNLACLK